MRVNSFARFDHPDLKQHRCPEASSILDTSSILGVSSIFRTPSTECIRVLAAEILGVLGV